MLRRRLGASGIYSEPDTGAGISTRKPSDASLSGPEHVSVGESEGEGQAKNIKGVNGPSTQKRIMAPSTIHYTTLHVRDTRKKRYPSGTTLATYKTSGAGSSWSAGPICSKGRRTNEEALAKLGNEPNAVAGTPSETQPERNTRKET